MLKIKYAYQSYTVPVPNPPVAAEVPYMREWRKKVRRFIRDNATKNPFSGNFAFHPGGPTYPDNLSYTIHAVRGEAPNGTVRTAVCMPEDRFVREVGKHKVLASLGRARALSV